MKRTACLIGILCATGLLSGCVDRRYVITSDPPGAIVLRDGKYIGATPVDEHFTYYGVRRFTLIKDGFQTQTVAQDIPAPWYQWLGIDFVAEVLWPCRITDKRDFHYQMQPQETVRSDVLLGKGTQLRQRGQAIVSPPSPDTPLEDTMQNTIMAPAMAPAPP